jgi:hypothetical protein
VTLDLIESMKSDIEDHAERRIQLFLQQLLLVYKTGIQFEKYRAYLQVGSGNATKGYEYAAAHNATLPSLLCSRAGESVLFAKNTPLAIEWNETALLPTHANQVDSRLDLHHGKLGVNRALRDISIRILNRTAQVTGGITPKEGLQEFLLSFDQLVGCARTGFTVPAKQRVLDFYQNPIRSYIQFLQGGDQVLARLCHLPDGAGFTDELYQDLQLYMYKKLLVPDDVTVLAGRLFSRRVIAPALPSPQIIAPLPLSPQIIAPPAPPLAAAVALAPLQGRAGKYAASCQNVAAIRALAAQYLQNTAATVITSDKALLPRIGKSREVSALGLSPGLKALYDAILQHIRTTSHPTVQEPQNMGSIVTWILDQN